MNVEHQPTAAGEPSLPEYSVDWRFLLPVYADPKMLVIHYKQNDYARSLNEIGMPFDSLSVEEMPVLADQFSGRYEARSFDIVAAPFGIRKANEGSPLEDLKSIRNLLRPNGSLLLGVPNRWSLRRKGDMPSRAFTIAGIGNLLRAAGYEPGSFYGALPEPVSPEYIFPLDARSLGFVLNHRYQHKLPDYFLRLMKTFAVNVLLNFLPFYYVVARVK